MDTTKLENGVSDHLHHVGERFDVLKTEVAKVIGPRVSSFAAFAKKHPIASVAVGIAAVYVGARLARRGA